MHLIVERNGWPLPGCPGHSELCFHFAESRPPLVCRDRRPYTIDRGALSSNGGLTLGALSAIVGAMQLHHMAAVPEFDGSYALISSHASTTTAIVFVHGFWGDSYSTWQDFQVLVDEYASRFPAFV